MPPCGPPKACPPPPPCPPPPFPPPPPPPPPPCAYAGTPLTRSNAAVSAVSRTNFLIVVPHTYDAPVAKPDARLAANRRGKDSTRADRHAWGGQWTQDSGI